MDLGVLEGQTRGGYFLDSIFDPSVKQCNEHVVSLFYQAKISMKCAGELTSGKNQVNTWFTPKTRYIPGGTARLGPDSRREGVMDIFACIVALWAPA